MNTPTGYDAGYTGRAVRHVANRATGWRRPENGGFVRRRELERRSRATRRRFRVRREPRPVRFEGWDVLGRGNRELQPHGHMVEVWAENAQEVTLDCGGKSVGRNAFAGDRHGGEDVLATGSVSIKGVVMRRCTVRADPAPSYRPYYPGRPGYGPGARDPAGTACWPEPRVPISATVKKSRRDARAFLVIRRLVAPVALPLTLLTMSPLPCPSPQPLPALRSIASASALTVSHIERENSDMVLAASVGASASLEILPLACASRSALSVRTANRWNVLLFASASTSSSLNT